MDTRPRVRVIVLKYKSLELEVKCAQALLHNTDWPYSLEFYDNRYEPCHFSKKWNELIQLTPYEYVCIMDSDVQVEAGWLTKLMQVYQEKPDCVLVVPSTNNCGNPAQVQYRNKGIIPLNAATPIVGLYHQSSFEKVGWFDEAPEFAIFGQDSEWVARARYKGYGVYLQSDCYVHHVGNGSTRKASDEGEINFENEKNRAGALFRKKKQAYGQH